MTAVEANDSFLEASSVEFRDYQENIANKCVGKNSLVVIPTGLGKTIIGVLVAAKVLKIVPKGSKVIVLAPTRPLIEQHYQSFARALSIPREKFAILTGKTPPEKRADLFRDMQVLFFTPQTLRNDLVNRKYDVSTACLIIFDEAHHASGEYPYPLIADKYIQQNPDGTILALTASPGSSKKRIIDLCTTLHVPPENIHIRSRKDEDVKGFVKPMDMYKIGVHMSGLMEDAFRAITQILEGRLNYLSHLGFLSHEREPFYKHVLRKDLLKLNADLLGTIKGSGDKTGAYAGISVNAQALILHHMLELIEQQGLDILLEYMEKMRFDARKQNSSKAVRMLAGNPQLKRVYVELKKHEEFSPEELVHPKLPVLKQCLEEEFKLDDRARVLVFVKLRNSVKNIVSKLEPLHFIRPARFVGQATRSKEDAGLSQKKQGEILEAFKRGEYNVLVATNVAEEGLDIVECDLVIFFDVVASEIRLIQRKGRTARHRMGKVLILYTKATRDDLYLNIALEKLRKMNINLKNKVQLRHFYEQEREKRAVDGLEERALHGKEDPANEPEGSRAHLMYPKPRASLKKPFTLDHFAQKLNKAPRSSSNRGNAGIVICKDLPLKYGLRSELRNSSIPFTATSSTHHVIIHGKVLVQVYDMFSGSFSLHHYRSLYEEFRRDRDLVIFIFDFVDFKERFGGEKRLLKKKLQELSENNDLQVVPIDNYSELFFLVRTLHEQGKIRGC